MSGLGVLVMLSICGFVWGGFVWLLRRALRSEAKRLRDGR